MRFLCSLDLLLVKQLNKNTAKNATLLNKAEIFWKSRVFYIT